MVIMPKNSFSDLERMHNRLQTTLTAARNGLQHWRKWDADYEALKEQVLATDTDGLGALCEEFSGLAIRRREVDEIILGKKSRDEVVATLDHRLEYVGKNVATLDRQVAELENKLGKVEILLDPEVDADDDDAEGLPLTEIVEELDNEGNVLVARLQRPGEAGVGLGDLLKRVGVELSDGEEEVDDKKGKKTTKPVESKAAESKSTENKTVERKTAESKPVNVFEKAQDVKASPKDVDTDAKSQVPDTASKKVDAKPSNNVSSNASNTASKNASNTSKKTSDTTSNNVSGNASSKNASDAKPSIKASDITPSDNVTDAQAKNVSFAAADDDDDYDDFDPPTSETAKKVERIMKVAREQEEVSKRRAVLPADESAEDAALRREMLQYTMGEVGAVVAELEIVEGEYDSSDDDFEHDLTEDEFEDEDKWGRDTGSVVDDAYRERMRELEKKYGIRSRFTPREDAEVGLEGVGRITIRGGKREEKMEEEAEMEDEEMEEEEEKTESTAGPKKGKSVHFSSTLDIAPIESTPVESKPAESALEPPQERDKIPFVDPTSNVIERSGGHQAQTQQKQRKTSRFKKGASGRVANLDDVFFDDPPKGPFDAPKSFGDDDNSSIPTTTAPTGPPGKTLVDRLVEKETPAAPPPTGAFGDADYEASADAELRAEYHRLRNKFVHRQGGFLAEDTREVRPVEEDGQERRVSKFKAARLGGPV